MKLAIVHPAAHISEAAVARAIPVLKLPVTNNLKFGSHKVTGLLKQYSEGNHFVIFHDPKAAAMYSEFLYSVATTGEAVIH